MTSKELAAAEWTTTIRPHGRWLNFGLGELWRYRDLVALLVRRDFVANYKQTVLGPAWHVINPIVTTLVMTVVFGRIARLSTDGVPPFLFYLAGTTIWNFFARSLTSTSNTFVGNAGIFGKVYFPRLAVPLAGMITNSIAFAIQFTLFLICLGYFAARGAPVHVGSMIVLTPIVLLLVGSLGLGAGIIASSLTTRYRDLTQLVTYGVTLLMYFTPVIYPMSSVPDAMRPYVLLNPLSAPVEAFRAAFLGRGELTPGYLAYSAAASAVLLFAGVLLFHRVERTFMDTV